MDAARHRRHKQHIPRIAPPIAGLCTSALKFPVVGTGAAAGMDFTVRLSIGELRVVLRELLVEHQNVLRLFQRRPVGVEKARSPFLVPHPLIAEHGEVGGSQHLVKGALGKQQHSAIGLYCPTHRLPQRLQRQGYIPIVPGGAVGWIGQEHIHRMMGLRQQPLDPVHQEQSGGLWDILSQGRLGQIRPPFSMGAENASGDGAGFE